MAKRAGMMSDDDLSRIIDGQISDALTYTSSDRATHREAALRAFDGKVKELPDVAGRSTVVSRDVSDLHGLILPSLLRVFFSSTCVAVYEPTREEHEEYADQATDYVNYVVMKECGGYRLFRDAFSDGILIGNGVMKHWWDKTKEYSTDSYSGLDTASYNMLLEDPDLEEVTEHNEYPDPNFTIPPDVQIGIDQAGGVEALTAMGVQLPQPEMFHDVTIKRVVSTGRLKAAAVPDEEFLIDSTAKCLDETVRFCAHVSKVTRSELVKEGFPKSRIDEIPAYAMDEIDQSREDRDDLLNARSDNAPDKSTEYVQRYECYVLLDYNGDGIAERRRIIAVGGTGKKQILSNEEWADDLPFSDVVPDPRPHTWRGRGIFDDAYDMMQVKTMGLRGIIDNMYQIINPQQIVYRGSIEDASMGEVINPTFGGIILATPSTQPGTPVVEPVKRDYIAPQIAPLLDHCDKVLRRRTGISEESMALDMDKLQNQTATASAMAADQAHSKTEEYARNIANFGGLKRFFACCLKLITKYQDRPKTIRLRGKWVNMDPRAWDANMDVTVNVGLGTGSRNRDIAMLQGVRASQKEYVGVFGPFNEFCNIGHIADTDRKMAEAAGLSNPDNYFPDISQEEIARMREKMQAQQAQQPPDPKLIEAQQKMQLEKEKSVADLQMKREDIMAQQQMSRQQAEADLVLQSRKAELDFAAQQQRTAYEMEALREKAALELELKRQESAERMRLKREEMLLEAQLTREANMMRMAQSVPVADTNITAPGV